MQQGKEVVQRFENPTSLARVPAPSSPIRETVIQESDQALTLLGEAWERLEMERLQSLAEPKPTCVAVHWGALDAPEQQEARNSGLTRFLRFPRQHELPHSGV
jgi:hypothetical protein